MLVNLATKKMTTLERIRCIHEVTSNTEWQSNNTASKISQLTEFVPSIYLSIAAKLYTRWHISSQHNPLFNLVITNVPGPQLPMYTGKAQLVEQYGSAPIFHGMGLSIVVLSYDGHISISTTSCRSVLPNPNQLLKAIESSYQDLIETNTPKKPKRLAPKKKASTNTNKTAQTKANRTKKGLPADG